MHPTITLVAALVLMIAPRHAGERAAVVERAAINDNRAPAGTLRGGVLTLDLEVREVDWRPDRDDQPGIVVRAFAERGKRAQHPGSVDPRAEGHGDPRVRAQLARQPTLYVHGLYTRGAPGARDTVQIAPGSVREVRFNAGAPGTYYYSGPRPRRRRRSCGSRGMDSLSSTAHSSSMPEQR